MVNDLRVDGESKAAVASHFNFLPSHITKQSAIRLEVHELLARVQTMLARGGATRKFFHGRRSAAISTTRSVPISYRTLLRLSQTLPGQPQKGHLKRAPQPVQLAPLHSAGEKVHLLIQQTHQLVRFLARVSLDVLPQHGKRVQSLVDVRVLPRQTFERVPKGSGPLREDSVHGDRYSAVTFPNDGLAHLVEKLSIRFPPSLGYRLRFHRVYRTQQLNLLGQDQTAVGDPGRLVQKLARPPRLVHAPTIEQIVQQLEVGPRARRRAV